MRSLRVEFLGQGTCEFMTLINGAKWPLLSLYQFPASVSEARDEMPHGVIRCVVASLEGGS